MEIARKFTGGNLLVLHCSRTVERTKVGLVLTSVRLFFNALAAP